MQVIFLFSLFRHFYHAQIQSSNLKLIVVVASLGLAVESRSDPLYATMLVCIFLLVICTVVPKLSGNPHFTGTSFNFNHIRKLSSQTALLSFMH